MGCANSTRRDIKVDIGEGEVSAIRPVRRSGNSMVVSIPPAVLSAAEVNEGEELKVTAQADGGISLRPAESAD